MSRPAATLIHPIAYIAAIAALAAMLSFAACGRQEASRGGHGGKRLTVVTTLFPLYDFSRTVGGDKADVSLLLPPGVEPHSFEPRPADLLRIHKADIFVYTGDFMEPWAATLVKGVGKDGPLVVDSSKGVALSQKQTGGAAGERHGHADDGAADNGAGLRDPHIWLDLDNAQVMVDNILAAFVARDPANRQFYEKNAGEYKANLAALDEKFRTTLASCKTRLFVHGGHYAFNYLARRYGLRYVSVYGLTPDAEPSPRRLASIVDQIRRNHIKYIFYEELLQPRMAETLASETGARLLPLNGGHNVTRDDLAKGVTFISILEGDLANLSVGLQCK